MAKTACAFFMGANSKDGFVSLFDQIRAEDADMKIHAVKSGPGCGKSTCIKSVGLALHESGLAEHIFCSSDPGSFDGFIVYDAGISIVDGTSPHACVT